MLDSDGVRWNTIIYQYYLQLVDETKTLMLQYAIHDKYPVGSSIAKVHETTCQSTVERRHKFSI